MPRTLPRSLAVSTKFLQAVTVLVGIGAVVFLLWEPHVEGRNENATLFEIYFKDPFLAYAYLASISFFVALYQAFTVLKYAATDEIFSPAAVRSLRLIRICATVLVGFVVVGEAWILPNAEERPPAVLMGLIIALGSTVMAAGAFVCERILQNAIGRMSDSILPK